MKEKGKGLKREYNTYIDLQHPFLFITPPCIHFLFNIFLYTLCFFNYLVWCFLKSWVVKQHFKFITIFNNLVQLRMSLHTTNSKFLSKILKFIFTKCLSKNIYLVRIRLCRDQINFSIYQIFFNVLVIHLNAFCVHMIDQNLGQHAITYVVTVDESTTCKLNLQIVKK